MIRTFLFLLLAVPLFGAGCAQRDGLRLEARTMTGDQELVAEVARRLGDDMATSRLRLGVQASNGVVTLSGRIDDATTRMRAIALVRGIPGVVDVVDQTVRF